MAASAQSQSFNVAIVVPETCRWFTSDVEGWNDEAWDKPSSG